MGIYCHMQVQQYGNFLEKAFTASYEPFNKMAVEKISKAEI
jgi:hypothetical protein